MSAFANIANVCRTYMGDLESGERERGGAYYRNLGCQCAGDAAGIGGPADAFVTLLAC